jgi:protein-tyrosine phosphatase
VDFVLSQFGKDGRGAQKGYSCYMKRLKYTFAAGVLIVCCIFLFLIFNNNFHEVVDGRIFRSAQFSGADLEKYIRKHELKTIINLRGENRGKEWYETEKEIAANNHVELYDLRLEALTLPPVLLLDAIVETLQNAKRPLLIHCHSGVDRTGLVSALALAIELDPPISLVKNQLSLNLLTRFSRNSVGVLFFSAYEKWLRKTDNEHHVDNLLFFIKHEYFDDSGNIEYAIDTVQDVIFKAKTKKSKMMATVHLGPANMTIRGWAFHVRSKLPVYDLFVVIDHTLIERAKFEVFRPDVIEVYGLNKDIGNTKYGWIAEFESKHLSLGCHDVSLRIVNDRLGQFDILTNVEFCIEQ